MFGFLEGYKTYLQAAAAAIVFGSMQMGWIDEAMANTILGFLGIGIVASLRAGMK